MTVVCVLELAVFIVIVWYWRDRALQAERRRKSLREALEMWKGLAQDWSDELQTIRDSQAPAEQPIAGETGEEYVNRDGTLAPENGATLFNYANESFYYHWLAWNRKHD